MPKMERIAGRQDALSPLRVTGRKAHKKGRITHRPRIRVKCGCCEQAVEICHEATPTGNENQDILEINGVHGTIDQWRKVLLPLLGVDIPAQKSPVHFGPTNSKPKLENVL